MASIYPLLAVVVVVVLGLPFLRLIPLSRYSHINLTKMAEYDLTKTIIPYLDRHFAFPLLAHLVETETFPVEEVQAAQYELAKGTNMVDYAVNLYEQLQPDKDIPEGALLANHGRHLPTLGRAVSSIVGMLLYDVIVRMHSGLR